MRRPQPAHWVITSPVGFASRNWNTDSGPTQRPGHQNSGALLFGPISNNGVNIKAHVFAPLSPHMLHRIGPPSFLLSTLTCGMDPKRTTSALSRSLKIAAGFYSNASQLPSARRALRWYADEIDSFAKQLETAGREIDNVYHVSAPVIVIMDDLVRICERVLEPLERLQNALGNAIARITLRPKSEMALFAKGVSRILESNEKMRTCIRVIGALMRVLDALVGIVFLREEQRRERFSWWVEAAVALLSSRSSSSGRALTCPF